jgi:hypothetical protein
MARDLANSANGILRHSLADGMASFGYRTRVYSLLGFPRPGGVAMNFPKPLPIAGFSYVVPRFSGEFELPDDLLAGTPQRAASLAASLVDKTPSVDRTVVTSRGEEPAARGREMNTAANYQSGELKTNTKSNQVVEHLSPTIPRVETENLAPQLSPSQGNSQQVVPSNAQTRWTSDAGVHRAVPDRASQKNFERAQKHDCPQTASTEIDSLSHFAAKNIRPRNTGAEEGQQAGQEYSSLKISKSHSADKLSDVVMPPPADGSANLPVKKIAPELEYTKHVEPQIQRELKSSSATVPRLELLVASSHPRHAEKAAIAAEKSRSSRQTNQGKWKSEHTSSEARQPDSPHTPTAQTTSQKTQVVVKQVTMQEIPVAFWERRYLSHLRVRIRR